MPTDRIRVRITSLYAGRRDEFIQFAARDRGTAPAESRLGCRCRCAGVRYKPHRSAPARQRTYPHPVRSRPRDRGRRPERGTVLGLCELRMQPVRTPPHRRRGDVPGRGYHRSACGVWLLRSCGDPRREIPLPDRRSRPGAAAPLADAGATSYRAVRQSHAGIPGGGDQGWGSRPVRYPMATDHGGLPGDSYRYSPPPTAPGYRSWRRRGSPANSGDRPGSRLSSIS